MLDSLQNYLTNLREQKAGVVDHLQAGATATDLEVLDRLSNCEIPEAVKSMWHVFNGTSRPEGVTSGELWLDGNFIFFSVGEAVQDYGLSQKLWEEDPDFENYLPKGFLPIATPGEGSRLLVNCRPSSPTHGGIYELLHGHGIVKHSASLSDYFKTLLAALKQGGLVIKEARVKFVEGVFDGIAKQMNPHCDAFNTDLPAAMDTRDWLSNNEGNT